MECLAYHVVIDRGGYCHVIHEDFTECLAHTWHRNSRSIGAALACCRDACCYYDAPSGVDLGCEPPTEAQVEALAMFCARAVEELGLSVSDIYTHAEMGSAAVIRICAGICSMSPITVTAAGWFPAVS